MRLADDLHVLILFDRQGRECYRGPKTRDTTRPTLGASYLIAPERELVFKPYHLGQPSLRPRPASTRRLSNLQILAAAKRFEADGEMDNAVNMLGLLK